MQTTCNVVIRVQSTWNVKWNLRESGNCGKCARPKPIIPIIKELENCGFWRLDQMYDHMCKIRWVNNMVKKKFFISNLFDGSSSPDLFLDRTILFYLLASPLSNIRLISSKRVIQVFVRKIIYSQTIIRSNRGIRIFIRSMSFFLWNSTKTA